MKQNAPPPQTQRPKRLLNPPWEPKCPPPGQAPAQNPRTSPPEKKPGHPHYRTVPTAAHAISKALPKGLSPASCLQIRRPHTTGPCNNPAVGRPIAVPCACTPGSCAATLNYGRI
ncbi:hypothetical protein EJ06DRAFT_527074 [Trichodelitschia bisporula]|uniref:Uncharacterized protein n=1 Tax=Trichodelitschia bisporula TaxID=703511 RepID=A0A6G1I5Q6_9PEZI|nr:hypothetical protein EJ06DRAFT_527074 [Trichodelitschia bisporula]